MTNMIDIDGFMPKIVQYVRNAPEPTVKTHLRDILREFCAASRIWREVETFAVADPDYQAELEFDDADVLEVEDCWLGDHKLTPKGLAELDIEQPGWRYTTDTGTAEFITQLSPDVMLVVPKEAGDLKLTMILQPALTATEVPDFLLNKYGTQIGRGTAARVMLLPGTEFSNADLAAPLLKEFDGWMAANTIKVLKGQQKARKRTKGSWF